jgi:hypothetical protein
MFWFTRTRLYNTGTWNKFDSKNEQQLHSLWLIEKINEKWDETKSWNYYKLTEKWNYFLKKSTLE